MAEAGKQDFITEETEKAIAEFERKLRAEQAALPDTSIRSGAGGINVLENYYFREGTQVPIYDSGTNKQIDRVDMEVDRMRRARHTFQAQDEVDEIMHRIHEERMREQQAEELHLEKGHQTEPFVYAVPIVVALIAAVFIIFTMGLGLG